MEKTYLLDTNIVSEFVKKVPDDRVLDLYFARRHLCAIAAITWQELTRGVKRMPEGQRRVRIQNFIDSLAENMEVLPYDKFSAQICSEIQARAEKEGKSLPSYASQIAATAISRGMVLVTHNIANFESIKETAFLRVEDWFTA